MCNPNEIVFKSKARALAATHKDIPEVVQVTVAAKNARAEISAVAEVGSNTSSSENPARPLFTPLLPWLRSYCKCAG